MARLEDIERFERNKRRTGGLGSSLDNLVKIVNDSIKGKKDIPTYPSTNPSDGLREHIYCGLKVMSNMVSDSDGVYLRVDLKPCFGEDIRVAEEATNLLGQYVSDIPGWGIFSKTDKHPNARLGKLNIPGIDEMKAQVNCSQYKRQDNTTFTLIYELKGEILERIKKEEVYVAMSESQRTNLIEKKERDYSENRDEIKKVLKTVVYMPLDAWAELNYPHLRKKQSDEIRKAEDEAWMEERRRTKAAQEAAKKI